MRTGSWDVGQANAAISRAKRRGNIRSQALTRYLAHPQAMDDARRRGLTGGLLLTMSLHATHGLAVVTAMPVVARDLDGLTLYGAALAAYVLTSLIGLAVAGDHSDRLGLPTTFATGLTGFAAGIVLSAFAPSMAGFVAGRALEGLGGGMLAAVIFASVNKAYETGEQARVLSWLSAAWIVPGLAAPPCAGWVAETLGWRWVFLGLLPLVPIAAVLTLPALRFLASNAKPQPRQGTVGAAVRLAMGGALAMGGLGVSLPPSLRVGLMIIATGLIGPALLRLFPAGIFQLRPVLPAAIAAKVLLVFAFFAVDSFLPLVVTEVHQRTAAFAGWMLSLGSIAWSAGAFLQGRYSERLAAGRWIAFGAAGLGVGLALCALTLWPGTSLRFAFCGFGVAGFAMGVAHNAASALAMAATSSGREGQTSTWLGLADSVGVAFATGLGGVALAMRGDHGLAISEPLAGVWALGLAAAGMAIIAGIRLSRAIPRDGR